MRISNYEDRLVLIPGDHPIMEVPVRGMDVERASAGRFGSDPQTVFDVWPEFLAWAKTVEVVCDVDFEAEKIGPPVPRPGQVFAIGLNYLDHAVESRMEGAAVPPTFTKFPSCLGGPYAPVRLPSGNVDFEAELVVVIGAPGRNIAAVDAWDHVAGLMVGQDLSERVVQLAPPVPQFSLGKSFEGFGPTGPWLVTTDEVSAGRDIDNLAIMSAIDGETMQQDSTEKMILDVSALIAHLSSRVELRSGDLIFTGTPAGVGQAREPQRFLRPGELLVSQIEGVGEIRTPLIAG